MLDWLGGQVNIHHADFLDLFLSCEMIATKLMSSIANAPATGSMISAGAIKRLRPPELLAMFFARLDGFI
jgi:hypothetical protein